MQPKSTAGDRPFQLKTLLQNGQLREKIKSKLNSPASASLSSPQNKKQDSKPAKKVSPPRETARPAPIKITGKTKDGKLEK